MDLINAIIVSEDVELIHSIPVGNILKLDFVGWHHTKFGKYMVKFEYHIENDSTRGP